MASAPRYLTAPPGPGAVIHAHSVYSTAIACLRRDLPALHYYIVLGGGSNVRCAKYAPFGSQELADNALEALADRSAALLATHGMIVLGATLAQALKRTFELETLARLYVYASHLGEPYVLPDDEIERVQIKMRAYGNAAAPNPELTRIERRPLDDALAMDATLKE